MITDVAPASLIQTPPLVASSVHLSSVTFSDIVLQEFGAAFAQQVAAVPVAETPSTPMPRKPELSQTPRLPVSIRTSKFIQAVAHRFAPPAEAVSMPLVEMME